MDPVDAATICALRKVLDDILHMVVQQPEEVLNLEENYQKALGVIRSLSEMKAGDYQITREAGISSDRESNFSRGPGSYGGSGPSGYGGAKFQRTDFAGNRGGYGNNRGSYGRGSYGNNRGSYGNNRGSYGNNRGGFGN